MTSAKANSHVGVLISLHVCALLFGGTVQFSLLIPLGALDIMVYRTILSALTLAAVALMWKHSFHVNSKKDTCLLFLCSVLFAVHWVTYFHAMQISTIAVGLISLFTFPVMTVFIEPLFKGGKPQVFDIFMGIMVLVGVMFIAPEFDFENEVFLGVVFGLFSALTVSLRNVIISEWLSSYSPISLMFYHAVIGFFCLLPFAQTGVTEISYETWGLFVILAVVFTALPHTLITHSLKSLSAKTVSMIVSLQVVYAAALAYLLFEQSVDLNTVIGGALILGAALVETIRERPSK